MALSYYKCMYSIFLKLYNWHINYTYLYNILDSRSKVNIVHKMAEIDLLSDRNNSHLLNLMYKRKDRECSVKEITKSLPVSLFQFQPQKVYVTSQ